MEAFLLTARVPELVKPHPLRHLRAHESGVNEPHRNILWLQIEREQLADHVHRGFGSVVPVHAAAFGLVAEGDAAGFGGDENHFATGGDCPGGDEVLNEEHRADGRGLVHGQLRGVGGLVEGSVREVSVLWLRCDSRETEWAMLSR